MSPRLVAALSLLALAWTALPGCIAPGDTARSQDGADEDTNEDDEDEDDDAVQSGTCAAWKVSYCEAVDQCGSVAEKNECKLDVGYVQCLADAPYAACQDKLDAVVEDEACDDWPKRCEPQDIADRRTPTAACKELHAQKCEWLLYCGAQTSLEECVATLDAAEPCTAFTAVLPAAQECSDRFAVLQCDEAIPSECATEKLLR